MIIKCKQITIELVNIIKDDFDIDIDLIELEDKHYDTIILFSKYLDKDSSSINILDNILDTETDIITIAKLLNLFMFLNWKINFDFLFSSVFPIIRSMPFENTKLFFDCFDENSIESWDKILRNFAENSTNKQFDIKNRGTYSKYYFWILNNLDRYWDKFVANNLFENLSDHLVTTLWMNYFNLGKIDRLNKLKKDVGRLEDYHTLSVFNEEIKTWIIETHPNLYEEMGFSAGQGPNPRILTDPDVLNTLPKN